MSCIHRMIMLASLWGMVQRRTRNGENDIVLQRCERAKHTNGKQERLDEEPLENLSAIEVCSAGQSLDLAELAPKRAQPSELSALIRGRFSIDSS